ncbi:MAG TPA: bifunctional aldolase/short-chain dehydrogenase [Acidimicrobiaceae bacterium]|nr:bifunctional aldolase/short-chain dehydrogenase [Acidimicrobiaceae bacterium]HCV33431.1 bifunctional aldolase/short-chain dehydrogenase [Acidimicrobiaceae bacterium]
MKDRWDDEAAAASGGLIAECVYCTRLIGADPALVLHGGGNSSIKDSVEDITGDLIDAIHVKGSGWDMATIEARGFAPLHLQRLLDILELDRLSDPDMMRELAAAKLDPAAPNPSVESLLHAYLPHRAVQHSHADVIIQLTNLSNGDEIVKEVFGDAVVVVPYVMPGFDLARLVREVWPEQAHAGTRGMVLLNHGLFTFGDDSATAYRRHVGLINMAEKWLEQEAPVVGRESERLPEVLVEDLVGLRRAMSDVAGAPLIVRRHTDPVVRAFVRRDDLGSLASRGPLTPDHVIRTKRIPMVGHDETALSAYVADYQAYVDDNKKRTRTDLVPIDPAPRIVLDPDLGMLAIGRSVAGATISADIYHHTMPVLARAEDHLGGYVPLAPEHLFDVEYWDLEQAKLAASGPLPEFAGMVALVTGAASGIGRACATELLNRGAAVLAVDRDASVAEVSDQDAWLGAVADVTDPDSMDVAIRSGVETFGGLDLLVVAAGIFGPSASLSDLRADDWRKVMAVNVDSAQLLFGRAAPLLANSPVGGRVVVVGSKNVSAPGAGAGAYSASKAALQQLCRVAALEWASDGIRINAVHPDAVFDTGLWDDELVAERAARYGLSPDEYRTRNLLSVEVSSAQVARSVVALLGDDFAATTGAQVPIDGGSDRVV